MLVVQSDYLAIDQGVRQTACGFRDVRELFGPVQTLAGLQGGPAIFDTELHAVAVQLDFMAPALTAGRTFDQRAELRGYKVRYACDPARFNRSVFFRPAVCVVFFYSSVGGIPAIGIPYRIGLAALIRRHEWLRRLALAGRDLFHAAP